MFDTFPVINASLSDVIYIFVTFFLMLWLFKAIFRFQRALRIRYALLNDQLVSIAGIGSFLSYFDGVTPPHLHAILHTRQAMPPELMDLLYVPYVLHKHQLILTANKDQLYLKIQLYCPCRSVAYAMTSFQGLPWRRKVSALAAQKSSKQDTGKAAASIVRRELFQPVQAANQPSTLQCEPLAQAEICDREVVAQALPEGITTISLPLFRAQGTRAVTEQFQNWIRNQHIAVFVCPDADASITSNVVLKTSAKAPKENAASQEGTRAASLTREDSVGDVEMSVSAPEPKDFETVQGMLFSCTVGQEVMDSFFPATQEDSRITGGISVPPHKSADVVPDVWIIDSRGRHFSAQEIFGLSSGTPQDRPTPPSSSDGAKQPAPRFQLPSILSQSESTNSASAASTASAWLGGEFVKEDCVVCMTDQKCVALIPCRHLCVCTNCLLYVDKCPVCRANFHEYVVIQCPPPASTSASDTASGLNISFASATTANGRGSATNGQGEMAVFPRSVTTALRRFI